jgi:hypothetical protein
MGLEKIQAPLRRGTTCVDSGHFRFLFLIIGRKFLVVLSKFYLFDVSNIDFTLLPLWS